MPRKKRKIPPDAFSAYVAMGPSRSYQALAEKYVVTKRAIAKRAAQEDWSERLERIEQEARQRSDRQAADTLSDMNDRHLRIAKALQKRALEGLMRMPLDQAKDIIRALDLGVRQERLVRGEPTERSASVEEVTKREIGRWLIVGDDDDEREPS